MGEWITLKFMMLVFVDRIKFDLTIHTEQWRYDKAAVLCYAWRQRT